MNKIDKLNKYKEYIRQCTSSPNSAENYSDFGILNGLIAKRYNGFTEILDCDDPDYLQTIYDDLDKLESFDEFKDQTNAGKNFKRIGNGQYHNALLNYIRFLRAIKLLGNYEPITEKALISRNVGFDEKILTAMRTKPFLLLAGISGTGKSRIVKQMAFESCPNIDQLRSDKTSPGNYQLIEVKPNWHDSTEVLGYESAITNKYIVTPFVKFLVKAMCHPDVPFFVCMDEMNLAPVEQYFAEFLSVLESRKLVNGTITSEPLIKADVFQKYGFGNENIFDLLGLKRVPCSLSEIESVMLGGSSATSEYFEREDIVDKLKREGLRIPSNLIVVGTVNMDETTHQFSRKVIDRAMTIEMNIADSKEPFNNFFAGSNELDYLDTPSRKELFLPTVVQANEALDRLSEEDKKYLVEKIPTFLHSLNRALNGTPFKIAYRVQNELVLYFYELRREEKNVSAEELLARAMDAILMLKVLPRIEGDEELLGEPLKKLAEFTANYKQAHAKVEEMQNRLNAHFTSFWP